MTPRAELQPNDKEYVTQEGRSRFYGDPDPDSPIHISLPQIDLDTQSNASTASTSVVQDDQQQQATDSVFED